MLTLLGQNHGDTPLTILDIHTLGVSHEQKVDNLLITSITEGKVKGKHALIILAGSTLSEGKEQCTHSTLGSTEDDGSMERQKTPAELSIGFLTRDPGTGLVGAGGCTFHGTIPILALDTQVKLSGVGIVITLKGWAARAGGTT
jgi:hypothetical protein